jgi:D-glycero-beta-D-manno-heptose 1-phosphate adenylyltransferase
VSTFWILVSCGEDVRSFPEIFSDTSVRIEDEKKVDRPSEPCDPTFNQSVLRWLSSYPTILKMDFSRKILTDANLAAWREGLRKAGKKLVATNGCFDILHLGHVTYLQHAKEQGDALLVGVTGDSNVQKLKGPNRPVNNEGDRAALLAALEAVDGVYIFSELDARNFLQKVQPDIYVKGGDYTIDTINQDERRLLEKMGVKIVLLPLVPGKSTTSMLEKISRL